MASIEFIEKLKHGAFEWNEFRSKHKNEVINLCYLNLPEGELTNIDFSKCDLTGATIQGANLDGSIFEYTKLYGSNLSNSSMIGCQLKNLTAENLNLRHTIIRNSVFTNVKFAGVDFSGVTISGCSFRSCYFENCKNEGGSELFQCEFTKCVFTNIFFSQTLLNVCFFHRTRISDMVTTESQICNCKFTQSKLINFSQKGGLFLDNEIQTSVLTNFNFSAKINKIDLTNSVVISSDVQQINPATAILLNTAFVHCQWPSQDGKISFWGRYIPNPDLLRQPVQDIRGINPLIRREIADAQFLVKFQDQNDLIHKFFCRVWGMTTAFGQSIFRLTVFSAFLLMFATIILVVLDGSYSLIKTGGFELFLLTSYDRFKILFDIFLGLGRYDTQSLPQSSGAISTLLVIVKIFGFFILGLWITIASNKISNLSSN